MVTSWERGLPQGEDSDLFRMRHGQGAEKEAIDHTEKRGVDGHPEGECDDANDGEAGVFGEGAKSVPEVVPEIEHLGGLHSEMRRLIRILHACEYMLQVIQSVIFKGNVGGVPLERTSAYGIFCLNCEHDQPLVEGLGELCGLFAEDFEAALEIVLDQFEVFGRVAGGVLKGGGGDAFVEVADTLEGNHAWADEDFAAVA